MRKFLVVLDDTRESLNAIRYAALRASATGGSVQVLAVIAADEIQHGMGVAEVMRAEAQERLEAHFQVFAKWMRDKTALEPELVIREGEPSAELLAQIGADAVPQLIVFNKIDRLDGTAPRRDDRPPRPPRPAARTIHSFEWSAAAESGPSTRTPNAPSPASAVPAAIHAATIGGWSR